MFLQQLSFGIVDEAFNENLNTYIFSVHAYLWILALYSALIRPHQEQRSALGSST